MLQGLSLSSNERIAVNNRVFPEWTARLARAVLFCALLCLISSAAAAQAVKVRSTQLSPETSVGSLSISATPSLVLFSLVPHGVAPGSTAVAVTTTWGGSLCLFTCTVNVYAYFASPTAALSGGSPIADIPSSAVLGQVPTGTPTSFTPFTQSSPFGGASGLELFSQSWFIFAGGGSRTDALDLEINLANLPQLPAAHYSGTLFIQAQSL